MILKHSIEVFKLNVQFGHTCVKQTLEEPIKRLEG